MAWWAPAPGLRSLLHAAPGITTLTMDMVCHTHTPWPDELLAALLPLRQARTLHTLRLDCVRPPGFPLSGGGGGGFGAAGAAAVVGQGEDDSMGCGALRRVLLRGAEDGALSASNASFEAQGLHVRVARWYGSHAAKDMLAIHSALPCALVTAGAAMPRPSACMCESH